MSDPQPQEDELEPFTVIHRVTFPVTLWERIENAAYWEGSTDYSKFICRAVRQWINSREDQRDDGAYPKALEKRQKGRPPKG